MPKLILVICIVLAIPAALFEYFVLFWFWGGDGIFTFIGVPIVFILCIGLHILLINKYGDIMLLNRILKFSLVLSTPVISMAMVWLFAKIFGVDITIQ